MPGAPIPFPPHLGDSVGRVLREVGTGKDALEPRRIRGVWRSDRGDRASHSGPNFAAAIAALSKRIRRFKSPGCARNGEGVMDVSLLMGAPIGLGILLAAGILMVVMSYLTQ